MAQTTEPTEDFMDFDEPVSDPLGLSSITGSRAFPPQKILIYGLPGVGKTTFAATFPPPRGGGQPRISCCRRAFRWGRIAIPHAVIGAAAPILGTPGMEGVPAAHGMRPPGMGHIQARGSLTRKLTLLPPPSDIPAAYRRSPPSAYAPTRQSST